METLGGKLIRTIGQTRADVEAPTMPTCDNPKRLMFCQKSGIKAF